MPEPFYTTPTALRNALGVDQNTLSDSAATAVIENAEDLIDELLGAITPDGATGRKIVESAVEPWRFTKLSRATTNLAMQMYKNPDLGGEATWKSVSGPDFSFSGRIGGEIAANVLTPLNQSGLRVLGVRAAPNAGRGRFDSFFAQEQGA